MYALPIAVLLLAVPYNAAPAAVAAVSSAHDVVIHAEDVGQQDLHGVWTLASDETAADTIMLASWDATAIGDLAAATSRIDERPLAAPDDFFDVRFTAAADTPYHLWLRLRSPDNVRWADSVWVQFSDARVDGRPAYELGTARGLLVSLEACGGCAPSGWGWQDSSWTFNQPATVTFASSGPHTLRIQVRGQGVQVDQIVLSPDRYLNRSPGAVQDDQTAVPRRVGR